MSVTPTGRVAILTEKAADLLAASSTWQTVTSTVTPAAAKAKTHQHSVLTGAWTQPMALLTFEGFTWDGPTFKNNQRGTVRIHIEIDKGSGGSIADEQDEAVDFLNNIGNIVNDMATASGLSDALVIQDIELENFFNPNEGERTGGAAEDYFEIDLVMEVGN